MKKVQFLVSIVLLVTITACAPYVEPVIENSTDLAAPFDVVWEAVLETLAEIHFPVKTVERDNTERDKRLITTELVTFRLSQLSKLDAIATKPFVFPSDWSRGRYNVSVAISMISENSTRVIVTAHIEAFSEGWHTCSSKGVIEDRIFNTIRSKILQ